MSYIAESAGGFAFIGRDGKLYIRTIYQDEQEIPLELFGDYKWGDKCTITKVSYENGVESFKFGNDTGNNLWLNQDNMYIVKENQVEKIYNQVKDLEAYSFEGKVIIDPALDVGDKIIVDGKPIIYQGEADFQTRFIAEISNKISIKQKQETTVKTTSQKVLNRRVQSNIDEINGKITQIVQETDENTEKISQHTQTIDEITDTLQSVTTTVSETVKEVQVMYALSDSSIQAPSSGWSENAPEWQSGKYMWQKTVTTFSDDAQEESQPTCIQGAKGQDGTDGQDGINGEDGLGINSIETQYYLSTSETELAGGSWKTTQDKWTKGHYIWTRSKITWSDNSITYSTPIVAEGLNTANENADSANESTQEVTTKMSEVERTIEGITQTVNETTERLNNDYSTTEQMNSAIEQTAGSITSSVTESIENIQVGGTNLIENSAPYNLERWGISNSNSIELTLQDEEIAPYNKCLRIRTLNQPTAACGIYKTVVPKVLEEGKEYCFSIWLKATAATVVTVGYARGGQTTFNVTTDWKKFEYKFTALTPTGTSHGFAINVPAGTTAGRSVYVHSVKLEEGNKITAWSPAPSDDVKGSEIGTKIEQNAKSVQVAWNQLSQSIKFEGDNSDATIAFYDGDTKFGEMGANTVDDNRYISFATLLDYGQSISDGMAWGIQTTSDNKFWPILFIKDFFMANKNAGNFSGQLVLNFCDLVLGTGAIKAENIRIGADDTAKGIYFEDTESGAILMRVYPDSNIGYAKINLLDKISFYRNISGSNTLKIGTDEEKHVLLTDEGYISGNKLYVAEEASFSGDIKVHGHIYCNNGVEPFSTEDKKRNIEKYSNNALNEVLNTDIYYYNYNEDKEGTKRRVGAIIGDKYRCSREIIGTEEKGIDLYSMNSVAYKAIQELNEKVEQLQNRINELEQKLNEKEK